MTSAGPLHPCTSSAVKGKPRPALRHLASLPRCHSARPRSHRTHTPTERYNGVWLCRAAAAAADVVAEPSLRLSWRCTLRVYFRHGAGGGRWGVGIGGGVSWGKSALSPPSRREEVEGLSWCQRRKITSFYHKQRSFSPQTVFLLCERQKISDTNKRMYSSLLKDYYNHCVCFFYQWYSYILMLFTI